MSYMFLTLLASAVQKSPTQTGIPDGATPAIIGKLRPDTYTAVRDNHTLPSIIELSPAKRKVFTGSIITLDFPQRGMVHVMNYENGKRVVLDKPNSKTVENGVPLTKMLTTLPPKIDIRFTNGSNSGFDVKLPGEEKRLAGFTGALVAYPKKKGDKAIFISLIEGKVSSSAWLRAPKFQK